MMRQGWLLLVALALALPTGGRAEEKGKGEAGGAKTGAPPAAAGAAASQVKGGGAKPDFSGTWNVTKKDPDNFNGSNGYGLPVTITIKQTPSEIIVQSTMWGQGDQTITYKTDGSDTIWDAIGAGQSGRKMTVKWRSKLRWDGNKLYLYTWDTALNQLKDVLTMNSDGTLNVLRFVEQPGPSVVATLTFTKG